METNNDNAVVCPKCHTEMVDGVCPKCGMKAEEIENSPAVEPVA